MAAIGASGDAVGTLAFQRGALQPARRTVPVEIAVAITYGGSTHAVLMASPDDLEDFAVGFSLTEGIVDKAEEIEAIERIDSDLGIEMRLRLAIPRETRLAARRRSMAGPVGCGLCGIESLEAATRILPAHIEAEATFTPAGILAAMAGLAPMQTVNAATHAVHAAAFWRRDRGLGPVREDIGRHNALDKLAGALARDGIEAADGAVLLTSRVSVEMVQKTAVIGAPLIVAVSAPSDLAIRTADAAGITLVAVARADGFEVFTHARRILAEELRVMSPDKLVRMANQIALFFAAQGADAAPEAVATHLRQFWDPRMRRAILAHAEGGGAGLSPIAAAAVARLAVDEPA